MKINFYILLDNVKILFFGEQNFEVTLAASISSWRILLLVGNLPEFRIRILKTFLKIFRKQLQTSTSRSDQGVEPDNFLLIASVLNTG